MDDINKRIGGNIRELRELRALTRAQLANLLVDEGYRVLSCSTIARWESGEVSVPADALVLIARVLQCTVCTICDQKDVYGPIEDHLMQEFHALPVHEQKILAYLASAWHGNTHVLIEFCLMYASLPDVFRTKVARRCITLFEKQRLKGTLSPIWKYVDYLKIIDGWQNLGNALVFDDPNIVRPDFLSDDSQNNTSAE